MVIYLFVYSISCLFFKMAEMCRRKTDYKMLVFLAIIIPCILAGFRSETIGTDVLVYVKPLFGAAQRANGFFNFLGQSWAISWRDVYVYEYEIGFCLLIYFVTKVTNSLQMVLFFIQVFISVPIYFGVKRMKSSEKNIWYNMLVYYLMLYNLGYNMMRQGIAMAMIFLGISYLLKDDNWKKFWLYVIVATLFHTSALLLGIVYILIYRYLYSKRKMFSSNLIFFKSKWKIFLLVVVIIMIILNRNIIITFLENSSISNYAGYIKGDLSLSIRLLISRLPIVVLFLGCRKKFLKKNKISVILITFYIIDLIIVQLSTINENAGRIANYFSIFNIILFPLLCESWKNKNWKRLYTILIIGYLLIYWYYSFVFLNSSETVPYMLFV